MATKREREAEGLKRRKQVRLRFKNLIRSVVFNRIWLNDLGEQKLSLNVKKNIAMLVRTQRKIGMLTLAEKALIRTIHAFRSTEDRRKLVNLLASLTCFSKIPPKVRARLVPIVQFLYLTPGRVIIKEGHFPTGVYFILTGEVEITKRVYDQMKKEYVDKVEFISGPGDCLGDVEMIENTLRRNTYTATTEVELLVVYDQNFDNILRPSMGKQWLDKKLAIQSLHYFNFFTEEQTINACKLGVMRQFEPLETIYYEDKGPLSYVHFVISGECMILQCLKMKVTQKAGTKSFQLVDISKDDADTMFQDLTNKELMMKLKEETLTEKKTTYNVDQEIASNEDVKKSKKKAAKAVQRMDIKTIEISCGLRQPSVDAIGVDKILEQEDGHNDTEDAHDLEEVDEGPETISKEEEEEEEEEGDEEEESPRVPRKAKKVHKVEQKPDDIKSQQPIANTNESEEHEDDEHEEEEVVEAAETLEGSDEHSESESESSSTVYDENMLRTEEQFKKEMDAILHPNTKTENRFIDVGSLTFGGIFGLGESLEHRVIMARTTVQCLMLPRFWLFEKEQNPGNIWQRRRFYLDSTIPSRDSLYKDFLTTRKWHKFKTDLIERILDPESNSNPTKVQDIPIICRIVEAHDD